MMATDAPEKEEMKKRNQEDQNRKYSHEGTTFDCK